MNTAELIDALGGTLAVTNACDGEMTEANVYAWGKRGTIPKGWEKFLRLKLNRNPAHKEAWAQYDEYLAERAAPQPPEPEGMASQT